MFDKCDVLVNVRSPKEDLEFSLPNPVRRRSPEWVPVRRILNAEDVTDISFDIAKQVTPESKDLAPFKDIHAKLDSIKRILETRQIFLIIVDKDLEEVAEIFSRLNEAGTKVQEADVALAQFAACNPGWVRDYFNVFLRELEDHGFELQPSVLVRSLLVFTGAGSRIKQAPRDFWRSSDVLVKAWKRLQTSVAAVVQHLSEHGVLCPDMVPSKNALIPLFLLHDRFSTWDFTFDKAFWWFLLSNRAGRYSGSAMSAIDQDIRIIRESESCTQAVARLKEQLNVNIDVSASDLKADYRQEKFLSLLLYLLMFRNSARGWTQETNFRVGFQKDSKTLEPGFSPEWHHFFPKAALREAGFAEDQDALANMAVLPAKVNRTFSKKPPNEYLEEFAVPIECLDQQYFPKDKGLWKIENFTSFLEWRSETLAKVMTEYLADLGR